MDWYSEYGQDEMFRQMEQMWEEYENGSQPDTDSD